VDLVLVIATAAILGCIVIIIGQQPAISGAQRGERGSIALHPRESKPLIYSDLEKIGIFPKSRSTKTSFSFNI
jgi:hypothetical protein